MALRIGEYAESIDCCECGGRVRFLHARVLKHHRLGLMHVEFETACVDCGRWDTSVRVVEELPKSERLFCRRAHLLDN